MDRLACADVYALPLQILLRRYPCWVGHPAAVVAEDRPQGEVSWVNEAARRAGVLPGQRYASALSLCRDLRASVVPPAAIGAAVAELTALFRGFTPNVEPSADEPGIFWLDAAGLVGLYDSLDTWTAEVKAALTGAGFRAALVVGWSRFGSYALARALPARDSQEAAAGVALVPSEDAERRAALTVSLARLGLAPKVRDRLARLGVHTVGAFLELPPLAVRKRYGLDAHDLWRRAQGDLAAPLNPVEERPPAAACATLDYLERNANRVLKRIEGLLDEVARTVMARHAVIAELRLLLTFDGKAGPPISIPHRIRPAAPTLDAALLIDLVRLRLESIDLRAGVIEIRVGAVELLATAEQLRLFAGAPRRDRAAAERALARVRAELGDDAVGRFILREGHLPEARFAHVPLDGLEPPQAARAERRVLVRRLFARAVPLPPRSRQLRNDGWQPRDPQAGPIMNVIGPYVVSGGWWRSEVHRSYIFGETQRGDLLWVYFDRRRRRWFEQGRVE